MSENDKPKVQSPVSVVMPAHNEASGISASVSEIRGVLDAHLWRGIVLTEAERAELYSPALAAELSPGAPLPRGPRTEGRRGVDSAPARGFRHLPARRSDGEE